MGTWGVGLYSNDATADLREDFKEVVRAPWDADRLVAWTLSNYPGAADPSDDDYADMRLVLADLFWSYGIEHAATFETAQRIVADGSDLAAKRARGMGESDLERRAKVLDGLAERWREPNPRPRRRRVLAKPQPFVLEVGACMVYPASQGVPRNPYVRPQDVEDHERRFRWAQDSWGAAIVLGRYHQHDVFARYVVAPLRRAGAANPAYFSERPAASDFRALEFVHGAQYAGGGRRVYAVDTSRLHLDRMGIEIVCRLAVDERRIAAEFPPDKWPLVYAPLADGLLPTLEGRHGPAGPPVDDPIERYLAADA